MKILLLGEYSNVHNTLSEGFKALGHEVCVASDGDSWKNYPRDINLQRHSPNALGAVRYLFDVMRNLHRLKGFDIVQIINPMFLEFKAERMYPFYRFIRQHNKRVYMGAFGMDHYWVKAGLDCRTFKYSDFNIGNKVRNSSFNDEFIRDWIDGEKGRLNKYIAQDCDGIIPCLYEYERSYMPHYPNKTRFIPLPINTNKISKRISHPEYNGIRFFIGIQKSRDTYKGTDIMYAALKRLHQTYPDRMEIVKAESVPYEKYQQMMNSSDVILDQLYSYTPSMNSLLAMAKGIVVVGGGEEENYAILGETKLRPIVNVQPNEEDCYRQMEKLITGEYDLHRMSQESIAYINKYHDHIKVAQQYIEFWTSDLA